MVKAMRTQAVTSVSRLLPEESGHVAALPGCLDGMGVVVLPDVLDGVRGGARVEQNSAVPVRPRRPPPQAISTRSLSRRCHACRSASSASSRSAGRPKSAHFSHRASHATVGGALPSR